MSLRAAFAVLLLAGCAGAATQGPGGPAMTGSATTPAASAVANSAAGPFNATRSQLRRIGYRNCNGYAMELFAPARITSASLAQQSLFLNAYAYRAGGAIRLNLPGAASRLQAQTAGGWQDLPRAATLSGSSLTGSASAAVASAALPAQLGVTAPLNPGHYRAWLGQFSASRAGGAACAMTPVWHFDLS